MTDKTPKLPTAWVFPFPDREMYSKEQMLAFWQASRTAALEEAAKVVDGVCPAASQVTLRTALAAAIRALGSVGGGKET